MMKEPAGPASMPASSKAHPNPIACDRFVAGPIPIVLSVLWGLAEATVFFLVPDILLTALGCRALASALKATVAALAGALIGGTAMYLLGYNSPDEARSFLDCVRRPAF